MINLPIINTNRSCGDCSACCTSKGVAEINKSPGVTCPHLGFGCAIYETRPPSCRSYQCYWLQGNLDEEARPDKIGFVLDLDKELGTGQWLYAAQEFKHGAFDDEKVLYQLKRLVKQMKQPIVLNSAWREVATIMVPMGHFWKNKVLRTFGNIYNYIWC